MKFFKMKVTAVGTVVGSGFDKMGRVITDMIVHVDPQNKAEDGRYQHPIVTEDVAKKLEMNRFAERGAEVSLADVQRWALGLDRDAGSLITRDTEAARHEEFQEADSALQQPAALSTRDTTNFVDRDLVAGDIVGLADQNDEADAAPAPKAKGGARPAATAA